MTGLFSLLAHAVLLAYDFSEVASIVDLGGGEGQFLRGSESVPRYDWDSLRLLQRTSLAPAAQQ